MADTGQAVPRFAARAISSIAHQLSVAENELQEQLKVAGLTLAMNHRRVVEAVERQVVGDASIGGSHAAAPSEREHSPAHVKIEQEHSPAHGNCEDSMTTRWFRQVSEDSVVPGNASRLATSTSTGQSKEHSKDSVVPGNAFRHATSTSTGHSKERCTKVVRDALRYDKVKSNRHMMRNTIFADAATLKEEVRNAICQKHFVVTDLYHEAGICQYIAKHPFFEPITLGVIAFNAFWIGIDTDHGNINNPSAGFIAMENIFCAYFFSEVVIRTRAFARVRDSRLDPWYLFDTVLACLMVAETWLLPAAFEITGLHEKSSSGAGDLSALRLLRLVRLTRMARLIRLMRAVPELVILVKGMMAAGRAVCFTLCLLVIFIYVFGITFTQLTKDTSVGKEHFSTVLRSMNTLVIHGTFLDNCDAVLSALGREHELLRAFFLLYILLAPLTVMNMLIGVMVEVMNVVSDVEKEALQVNFVKQHLGKIISDYKLDATADGMISKAEFEMLLGNPEAARALRDVGVDVIGLVDYHDFLFDEEHEDGFSFPAFMEILLSLRGGNPASVKDLVDLRKFLTQENLALESRLAAKLECDGNTCLPLKAESSPPPASQSVASPSKLMHLQYHGVDL